MFGMYEYFSLLGLNNRWMHIWKFSVADQGFSAYQSHYHEVIVLNNTRSHREQIGSPKIKAITQHKK